MIKYRFMAWVILGLLVGVNGFSQTKSSGSQNRCNAQAAAYQAAQDKCLDYNAQVASLKAKIEAFRQEQELLLNQCNVQKQRAACDQLAALPSGHISALEQQYYALASVGCTQSGISAHEIADSCAADGTTPTSNQNKTAPVSPGKTPPNNSNNVSQSASAGDHQKSSSPPQRMQQMPPMSSGASRGDSFGRQAGFGGSPGGQFNTPPSAGAGRVK